VERRALLRSAMEASVDDVGFIGAIIDALVSNGRADPARVYVTGECRTAP
jgi:poly(3-hydroxybutyrate) depolymerase